MNQKELNEIRRRITPNKSNISKIHGCYVNSNKAIISYLEESLGIMSQLEMEKYMVFLKKALSGSLGKNLVDIVFSTQQVHDSDEHRLLTSLTSSELKDAVAREQFYQKVIQSLDMEDCNYLILLASDTYDVPHRGKDDEIQADASDTVFKYIICAVCPVRDGKPELGYFSGENEFHGYATKQIVAPPDLGFLFPAFDDRAANIYNALFYSKDTAQIHHEFIDAVFHTKAPMSADAQKETFQSVLADSLSDGCSYDVIQAVHEQIRERIEQHKERKDPDSLDITSREVGQILQSNGVPQEQVQVFQEKCGEEFGNEAVLNPRNIIDSSKFELVTPQVKISVDPEYSYMVETKMIDGKKYILIPADDGVEVNGVNVNIARD
ncbi:DUF4317 domain-containing protein [Oscillibacter sp.]|uniref:DUF4317 domain-containing protein n=1 Tax=Oscillibacter sp. TaxID=1945593 RepID=UPI0028AB2C11|nr:DUF4317 domain-containing protein [Oscillibacter sp.]